MKNKEKQIIFINEVNRAKISLKTFLFLIFVENRYYANIRNCRWYRLW